MRRGQGRYKAKPVRQNLANLDRAGLDFEDAALVFDGRPITTAASSRNNEDRFVSTAEIGGKLYTVGWMWRGANQRIISFRRARRGEEKPIVRYLAEDLAGKRERGETRSDWARAAAMTEVEIESDVASDPDEAGMVVDWNTVSVKLPEAKADLHMRIDHDVLDFFRKTGRGYQTRIIAVLRSYVERARRG
jgi:uncharacterized protein (DUF4415 family)